MARVAEWLYRFAAGVDTDSADAGFHTIRLHPVFDPRLGKLDFSYDSPFGAIHSMWTVEGKGTEQVRWTVTVPPNATAVLATERTNATEFRVGGLPLSRSPLKAGAAEGEFILPAGTYVFAATLTRPAVNKGDGAAVR